MLTQSKGRQFVTILLVLALAAPPTWAAKGSAEFKAGKKAESTGDYDQAVQLLKDLRDVAERAGRSDDADARIRQLRERHSNKSSLRKRLDQAGLKG